MDDDDVHELRGGWNYRVVRTIHRAVWPDGRETEEEVWAIHEVYYDENGDPSAVTTEPGWPQGDSLIEFMGDFVMYQDAVKKPTLKWEDIVKDEPVRITHIGQQTGE